MAERCSRKIARKSTGVEGASTLDGASQRDLIGIFQIPTVRNAAGDAAYGDAARAQLARQEQRGCLAVDRRGRRHDDLAHAVLAQALEQPLERQLVGADAVER